MNGEVIGINTAILSPTGGSVGIGFAVPTGTAGPVIQQLRDFAAWLFGRDGLQACGGDNQGLIRRAGIVRGEVLQALVHGLGSDGVLDGALKLRGTLTS